MSRFTTTLASVLELRATTQREFARACGASPAVISSYLTGKIAVSQKNLAILLRGISLRADQVRLMIAYLRDQIPEELQADILVGETAGDVPVAPLVEEPAADQAPFLGLNATTRSKLFDLTVRLRDDEELRELVSRTIDYLAGEDKRVAKRAHQRLSLSAWPTVSERK